MHEVRGCLQKFLEAAPHVIGFSSNDMWGGESSAESSAISFAQAVVVALMLVEGAGEAIACFERVVGLGVYCVAESAVAQ